MAIRHVGRRAFHVNRKGLYSFHHITNAQTANHGRRGADKRRQGSSVHATIAFANPQQCSLLFIFCRQFTLPRLRTHAARLQQRPEDGRPHVARGHLDVDQRQGVRREQVPRRSSGRRGGAVDSAGKDATEDFEDVGHSNQARATLKKYEIGELRLPSKLPRARAVAAAAAAAQWPSWCRSLWSWRRRDTIL